jgi:hypothetical protein
LANIRSAVSITDRVVFSCKEFTATNELGNSSNIADRICLLWYFTSYCYISKTKWSIRKTGEKQPNPALTLTRLSLRSRLREGAAKISC